MKTKHLAKVLIIAQAAGFMSLSALAQSFPVIVGNNQTVTLDDRDYSNNTTISDSDTAPNYAVAAVYSGTGSTVTITNSLFSNNYIEVANSGTVHTALISTGVSDMTIKDTTFRGNTSYSVFSPATQATGSSGSVIKLFVGNRAGYTNYGNYLFENVLIESNQSLSGGQAFGNVYVTNPNTATFRNTTFRNNLSGGAEIGSYNALGGAFSGYGIGDTVFENSLFTGNVAVSNYVARGGAIYASSHYAVWKDNQVSLNIRDTRFVGNSAVQVETEDTSSAWVAGGALYIFKSGTPTFQVDIANSTFSGNYVTADGYKGVMGSQYASGGGAIYIDVADVKISANRNITNTGNYAQIMGTKSDAHGGFLFLNKGSVEFAIDEDAIMMIGDGRVGYDSIASADSDSVLSKTGAGTLLVNSSMEYYTGTINVVEGVLDTRGNVGASVINVSEGATLALSIRDNNTLSNSDLVLTNNGIINLVAKSGLRGNYTVAANSDLDFGNVKAFGGTFADNVFSVNYAGEVKVGEPSEPIEVTSNAVVSVVTEEGDQPVLEMAFNVTSGSVTINSITDTTESLAEEVSDEYKYVSAFSFDVTLEDGDTVYLSFLIGDPTLSVDYFKIFYKGEGGEWIEASDISNIGYDGEYFSFTVSHFSEYGFAAIPEPSAYIALLGLAVLGYMGYRRRK